ncbi:uncharacterized protein EDB93DRAFT_1108908 [Suillus bovinus]|uniref:uncharacterized protein n=1 Tax=Suillus bovinus TaxID=48563 RepID=UPI001B881DD3|nr:uncharacterized protein EDB93DRAFT_1108908 [Suillus bovinus]KAG2128766.1 hypothetical protein EDB93DRAFT_1108908 [Suillus bovinus]
MCDCALSQRSGKGKGQRRCVVHHIIGYRPDGKGKAVHRISQVVERSMDVLALLKRQVEGERECEDDKDDQGKVGAQMNIRKTPLIKYRLQMTTGGIEHLVQETIQLLDLALRKADLFLPTLTAVHEFIYEVVRSSVVIRKQTQLL